MHRQAFDTLEFEKLRARLLSAARTPLGAALVAELTAGDRLEQIALELRRTGEGVAYLREGTGFDFSDLPDPRPALAKLGVADINLEPQEILDLLRLISVALGLRETFHDEAERFPLVREVTERVPNLRALYQRLRGRILPTGEVDDFASPELREVRFQILPAPRPDSALARGRPQAGRRVARAAGGFHHHPQRPVRRPDPERQSRGGGGRRACHVLVGPDGLHRAARDDRAE